ncbi:GNAT family N-acetyltransferase [Streptomyces sp. NBC_01381]|uniref:GNAT family N-acetyltransferase n=1 Tax=Streptomyces sp. NBC_01381 TaxID=2903845 RepID=UPI00224F1A8A|nr:GNAT family N-acetyltransferase [Streptomyces sp. NBC_01381]MCX4667483.1 GNAT family N-acetyltransferase [Streptomyces sp. NBC_01381]
MTVVRRALPEDAEELIRLRQVMIDSVFAARSGGKSDTSWHAESVPTVRGRLADPDGEFAAFVVDFPNRPGRLAASVVGTLDYRIGRAGNPHGAVGYVFSVATDPEQRRHGYARACMEALLDWFRERGAGSVDLNASAEAEPLYASLGFVRRPDPSMRLSL